MDNGEWKMKNAFVCRQTIHCPLSIFHYPFSSINSNISAHSVTPNIIYQGSTHNHNIEYMNELMRTQVGKMADVEFLVGTSTTHIKRGQITGVGTNYIVIKEYDTGRTMVGDFSDIKFVTIYDDF